MKIRLFCAALVLTASVAASAQNTGAVAESVKPASTVSLLVEPALSDGRLVLKVAAKNLAAAAVPFGPSAVSIAKPSGQAIGLYPLQSLINDVRLAAGMTRHSAPVTTQGAYAAPQMSTDAAGRPDVTAYTGGATVGRDEYVRRAQPRRRAKPSISVAEAEKQIATLKQAILQDSTLAPGQVAASQVVSDKLAFGKKEERLLHVRVRIGADEHSFTIQAPKE